MKTLTHPVWMPDAIADPTEEFTPARQLVAFGAECPEQRCQAELLVNDPADIAYVYRAPLDAAERRHALHAPTQFRCLFALVVRCPYCGTDIPVEEYPAPGSPLAQAPNTSWRTEIPNALRSAAYRAWEAQQTRRFWIEFFEVRDVVTWANEHPRAARKFRNRVAPAHTPERLDRAGFSLGAQKLLERLTEKHPAIETRLAKETHEDVTVVASILRYRLASCIVHRIPTEPAPTPTVATTLERHGFDRTAQQRLCAHIKQAVGPIEANIRQVAQALGVASVPETAKSCQTVLDALEEGRGHIAADRPETPRAPEA